MHLFRLFEVMSALNKLLLCVLLLQSSVGLGQSLSTDLTQFGYELVNEKGSQFPLQGLWFASPTVVVAWFIGRDPTVPVLRNRNDNGVSLHVITESLQPHLEFKSCAIPLLKPTFALALPSGSDGLIVQERGTFTSYSLDCQKRADPKPLSLSRQDALDLGLTVDNQQLWADFGDGNGIRLVRVLDLRPIGTLPTPHGPFSIMEDRLAYVHQLQGSMYVGTIEHATIVATNDIMRHAVDVCWLTEDAVFIGTTRGFLVYDTNGGEIAQQKWNSEKFFGRVARSSATKRLAFTSYSPKGDYSIQVIDDRGKEVIRPIYLPGKTRVPYLPIALSPDGHRLAIMRDNIVQIEMVN